MKILKLNSSVKSNNSTTKNLVEKLINKISRENTEIKNRALNHTIPLLTEEIVNAFYTAPDELTTAQKEVLSIPNQLLNELKESDVLVFGVPIYNFGVPAAVKAYFDLIARVGLTFKYGENGPVGLLENKKAYVVIASGGTKFKSDADFASNYIKHFLGFIGIIDVSFVVADQLMINEVASLQKAENQIAPLG